jgi:hypothetical protein
MDQTDESARPPGRGRLYLLANYRAGVWLDALAKLAGPTLSKHRAIEMHHLNVYGAGHPLW